MTTVDLAQLENWLGGLLWALGRVGGLCLIAPVLGSGVIPARIRVGLVVMLTLVLAPLAPAAVDPLSATGVATMVSQILIGASVGFVLKLVFEAVAFGGELVGQGMSLGFAEGVNPGGGGSVWKLAAGPVAINGEGLHAVVLFGAHLFAGAVRVALPAVTALLVVNIGFAAISRAAPSMNLFAVGLPATLLAGLILLAIAAPTMGEGITASIQRGLDQAAAIALGKP